MKLVQNRVGFQRPIKRKDVPDYPLDGIPDHL